MMTVREGLARAEGMLDVHMEQALAKHRKALVQRGAGEITIVKSLSDYYIALQAWKANALADLESELADLMVAHRTLH